MSWSDEQHVQGICKYCAKGASIYIHDTFSPSRRETYINDYCIYEFVLSSFNIRRGEDEYYALKNVAIDSTKRSQILCLI